MRASRWLLLSFAWLTLGAPCGEGDAPEHDRDTRRFDCYSDNGVRSGGCRKSEGEGDGGYYTCQCSWSNGDAASDQPAETCEAALAALCGPEDVGPGTRCESKHGSCVWDEQNEGIACDCATGEERTVLFAPSCADALAGCVPNDNHCWIVNHTVDASCDRYEDGQYGCTCTIGGVHLILDDIDAPSCEAAVDIACTQGEPEPGVEVPPTLACDQVLAPDGFACTPAGADRCAEAEAAPDEVWLWILELRRTIPEGYEAQPYWAPTQVRAHRECVMQDLSARGLSDLRPSGDYFLVTTASWAVMQVACSGYGVLQCAVEPAGGSCAENTFVVSGAPAGEFCFGPAEPAGCSAQEICTAAETVARDPQGRCWAFASGCIPAGWTEDYDCPGPWEWSPCD